MVAWVDRALRGAAVVRVAVCVFHFAIVTVDLSVLAPAVDVVVAAAENGVARVDAAAMSSLLCG